MFTKSIAITFISAVLSFSASYTSAKDINLNPKDTRTYSERERDRSWSEAKKGYDYSQNKRNREEMRDKTHDNRYKIGKDSSVGFQSNPPGVNYRTAQ